MFTGTKSGFRAYFWPVAEYFNCLERGRAACAKISEFLRRSLESQVSDVPANAA